MQSPYEAAEALAYMVGDTRAAFKPAHIKTMFAYMGGGFGGRDHSIMPLYFALAAMFFPDRPVRLAINRYEQFQSGIKRHAFKIHTRIGIDRATGKISGFAADHVLDGGGLANYSNTVSSVSAIAAIGVYDIPKVDIATTALHSRGVTAGSMRGYGTLQTMTALEVLIDEAAAALSLDPIEFRRRNALKSGGRIITGNTYSVAVRTPELLDKIEKHPIWRQRAQEKARGQEGGFAIGTGIAAATKNYGSGADCAQSAVEIDAQGRIAIHADHVDMGNGIGTALANRVAAHLGAVADEVTVHDVDAYGPLGARHFRQLLHHGPGDPGRRGRKSTLGAGDQRGHIRLERRACRHTGRGRGRPRHIPLRFMAGGARSVASSANPSNGQTVGGGALERGQLADARLGAAIVALDRGQGTRAS